MSKFHKFYITIADVDKFGGEILPTIKINNIPLSDLIVYDGTFIHINENSVLKKYLCTSAVDDDLVYSYSLLFYFPQGILFSFNLNSNGYREAELKIGDTIISQGAVTYVTNYTFPVMESIYLYDKTN